MNGIRAVSKKRAAALREYAKVSKPLRGGPCGARLADCTGRATEVHHIVSRARGGPLADPANLIGLCHNCHQHVTEHPLEAEKLGLSKRKEASNEQ